MRVIGDAKYIAYICSMKVEGGIDIPVLQHSDSLRLTRETRSRYKFTRSIQSLSFGLRQGCLQLRNRYGVCSIVFVGLLLTPRRAVCDVKLVAPREYQIFTLW